MLALYVIMILKIIFTIVATISLLPIYAGADTKVEFLLPSGVSVRIVESPFKTSDFKIDGCVEPNSLCLINGHFPYGFDLGLPNTYIKSIDVSYQGQSHSLDVSNMYNAWGSRPLEVKGVIRYFGGNCYDKDNCQFRGLFSDAAGSYVAEWRIINGVSHRTVLTGSGDIVNLFIQNIDPPIYE